MIAEQRLSGGQEGRSLQSLQGVMEKSLLKVVTADEEPDSLKERNNNMGAVVLLLLLYCAHTLYYVEACSALSL